jgi:hypothetical protein
MNEQQIKELSESMNVSVADLMCMAKSVANSIEQDKAKDAFIAMNEDVRVETTLAYSQHAVRKINKFTSTYLTNKEAKEAFQQSVLNLM